MSLSKTLVVSVGLLAVLALGTGGAVFWSGTAPADTPAITVYKSPTCGCCGRWVDYLRDEGFRVQAIDERNMNAVKRRMGIPRGAASCHTAVVDGYLVEGHVPAPDIRRMLAERPDVRGIAVPKMPVGSPGMEQGGRRQSYEVVTFDADGITGTYARYPASR